MPGGGSYRRGRGPAAGEADADLPSDGDVSAAAPHRAGTLPVQLSRQPAPSADAFHVRVADPDTAKRAGVPGVVVSVTPAGTATDALSVGVDYSGFANAAGANFGSRLRLVALPARALTTPEVAPCQVQTPLPSTNDVTTSVVSAKVASTVKIDKSRVGYYGSTSPTETITLTRDAFRNEEQLARTLKHERFHVDHIRSGM